LNCRLASAAALNRSGLTPVFSYYFPGKVHDHEEQNHIDEHVPSYPTLLEKDVT
jgi:hypothetical protein